MKQFNLIAAFLLAATCSSVSAQVTLMENGQTIFGDRFKTSPSTQNTEAVMPSDF